MFFTPGQQWAKLAYSEAGQSLASMNELEASEGASKNPAVTCCVNILG